MSVAGGGLKQGRRWDLGAPEYALSVAFSSRVPQGMLGVWLLVIDP